MKLINDILYIEYKEVVRSDSNPCGVMSESNLKQMLYVSGKVEKYGRGGNGNEVLINFDTLPIKYKDMILETHPDPRVEAATAPFIKRIVTDIKAQNYYIAESLSTEDVRKYTAEVSIWNALYEVINTMTMVRKHSPTGTRGVWDYGVTCINSVRKHYLDHYGLKFPTNPISIKRRYNKYLDEGYNALVHSNRGNLNRNIIKNEKSESMLLVLLQDPSQHDMVVIANTYNIWAQISG